MGFIKRGPDKAGAKSRFEQEALIHMDSIYNSALYMTKNERDAEDLTQETFLKAFRNFHQYKPDTNCRAWLFRIMVNTFLNKNRRSVRELSFLDEVETSESHVGSVKDGSFHLLDPEAGYLHQMFSDTVKQAIEALPPDFRTAVVLADLQDFSYKEIAEIMECPVGTVMSRIFRGRRLLRDQLRGYAVETGLLRDEGESGSANGVQAANHIGGSGKDVVSMDAFRLKRASGGGA